MEGDRLQKDWVHNGIRKFRILPPYAIADIKAATKEIENFVDNNAASYIEDDLDESDRLIWNTFSMAFRCTHFAQVRLLMFINLS